MRAFGLLMIFSIMAFAHTSVLEHGSFFHGFLHPLSGLDHILAMVGVGMVAFFALKNKILILASFIGAMIIAALVGNAYALEIPVEEGIVLSIAIVFGIVGFASKLPSAAIFAIVAFFGSFHGYAHGLEFTEGSFALYMGGFATSTLALHLSGMALGYFIWFAKLKKSAINNV